MNKFLYRVGWFITAIIGGLSVVGSAYFYLNKTKAKYINISNED